MIEKELIRLALEARERSYAPYSRFCVGAALLAGSGRIYTGCNIENAAYTPTNCAERTAFFKAVSEGEHEFVIIAIAGGTKGNVPAEYVSPCGVCRQVMAEFCDPHAFRILTARSEEDWKEYRLEELFPSGFSKEALQGGAFT